MHEKQSEPVSIPIANNSDALEIVKSLTRTVSSKFPPPSRLPNLPIDGLVLPSEHIVVHKELKRVYAFC